MNKLKKIAATLGVSVVALTGGLATASSADAAASGCYSDLLSPNGASGYCYYGPGSLVIHLTCSRPGYADKSGTAGVGVPAGGNANNPGKYYCPSTAWSRKEAWITWS